MQYKNRSIGCIIFELITLEKFVDHIDPLTVIDNLKELYSNHDLKSVEILINLLKM